jgi:N-acetylgalactosamine-N,N'-diacetylbacillosaminyl-diphospho-undecaprenol 4-alpha-N-acetylgalactosaminyltransferase
MRFAIQGMADYLIPVDLGCGSTGAAPIEAHRNGRGQVKPKILFVINSLAGGGAERVLTTLVGGSAALTDRYTVEVALLDREDEVYSLPDWVKVHRLDCQGRFLPSLVQMSALIRREKPDLTLSFLTRANVVSALTMRLRGKPFVISERVNTTAHLNDGGNSGLTKALVRLTYPWAKRVIAVSRGVGDTLIQDFSVKAERIVAVANPIDTSAIVEKAQQAPPETFEKPYVVAMGRLVPNKNFALAIQAFALSGLPGRLVILGEGPERAALIALGERLGLGERLQMPGFASNPYAIIAHAEFMALSSNAEGFPNALVEALAAGVSVVATDCASGPAEVLDVALAGDSAVEGRGGFLVPVNDAEAMAGAFQTMQDPIVRSRLVAKGAERVREFSVERAVARYWAVIEDALKPGA